jgi:hypothetical protein
MTPAESLSFGSNSKFESGEVQIKRHALWYIYGTRAVAKKKHAVVWRGRLGRAQRGDWGREGMSPSSAARVPERANGIRDQDRAALEGTSKQAWGCSKTSMSTEQRRRKRGRGNGAFPPPDSSPPRVGMRGPYSW